jgi:hypothetical protein
VRPRAPPAPLAAAHRQVHVAGDAAGSDLTVGKGVPSASDAIDSADRPLEPTKSHEISKDIPIKKSKIYLSLRLFPGIPFLFDLILIEIGIWIDNFTHALLGSASFVHVSFCVCLRPTRLVWHLCVCLLCVHLAMPYYCACCSSVMHPAARPYLLKLASSMHVSLPL